MKTDNIIFSSEGHKEIYSHLLGKTKKISDAERQALFYIIAGNDELLVHVNKIYDFNSNQLKISTRLDNLNAMCESSKALLRLAFQLYNSMNNKQNVYDTFVSLDKENGFIALEAIRIRFGL